MKKRIIWVSISIFLVLCYFNIFISSVDAMTEQQGADWALAHIGQRIDTDGYYGAQCKDFVNAFTKQNFDITFPGNAVDLIYDSLPAGWQRIKNTPEFIPLPGDIALWNSWSGNDYGHTAIIVSANINTFDSVDQNWVSFSATNGSPAARVTHNYTSNNFWGVLRPPYNDSNNGNATPTPSVTAPALNNPSSNATIQVNTYTNFSWTNTGASRYQFQITNPAGSDDSIYTSGTSCSYVPNTSGTWHWKVRKNTDTGVYGDWSETRYFTVPGIVMPSVTPVPSIKPTPTPFVTPRPSMQAAPTLYNPSDYFTLQYGTEAIFSWSDIGAPLYKIVLYHYFDSEEQYYYTSEPNYNYTPKESGSWYWKVCAVSDMGIEGKYSNERYFVVDEKKEVYLADLASTEIVFDSFNPVAGSEIKFSAGIQNLGLADTIDFNVKWYVNGIEKQNMWHDHMMEGSQDMDGNSQTYGNSQVFYWTPPKAGTYIITFAIDADGNVKESDKNNNMSYVEVNVSESQVIVTSIKLNKTKASLNIGEKIQLTAIVSPSNATDKSIIWKSSDKKIATVSSTGMVKGIKKGTVYIYAYSADEVISTNCKVTITSRKTTVSPTPTPVVVRGNSICNIVNGGLVAQQGEWIYYRNYNVDWCIYKVKTDGTGKKKLNVYEGSNINVVGDWLYFSNLSDNGYLYKMKTDGSKAKKLNSDNSEYISVVGDWIYYKNSSDDGHIYKEKTDGTKRARLNNSSSYSINIVGDWIYYLNFSDGACLYKIRTNGKDETKICNDSAYDLNVVGDWAYYKNSSDNDYLYKIKTDGTKRTMIYEDACAYISVSGGWVYYQNVSDHKSLYKIKTDGTQREKIGKDTGETLNIVGNWIYYENVSDGRSFYRIKTNGTGREKVK